MQTKIDKYGPCLMLHCGGDLVADTVEALGAELDRHLEAETAEVVLCLEQVGFIDSRGLEFLLDLRDRLDQGGRRLALCDLGENLRKIMEITRLEASFDIMNDSGEMLKSL